MGARVLMGVLASQARLGARWQGTLPASSLLPGEVPARREKSGFSNWIWAREEQGGGGGRHEGLHVFWGLLVSKEQPGQWGEGNAGRRWAESRLRGEHLQTSPLPRELEMGAEHRALGQM